MSFEALLSNGQQLVNTQRYQQAIAVLEQAIRLNPDNPEAYYYLGDAYSKSGETEKAKESYTKAARVRHVLIQKGIDMAIAADAQMEQARQQPFRMPDTQTPVNSNTERIILNKEEAQDYYRQSIDLVRRGDYHNALELLGHAIQIKPDFAEAFIAMGIVYNEVNDIPKSIESYLRALKLQPSHAQTHYYLSLAYLKMGMSEKALDEYTILSNLNTELAEKLFVRLSAT